MREIKFRAWDKLLKAWEYLPETGNIELLQDDSISFKLDFCDDFIIEQYTGLKDKNGKEIYEGDIVAGAYSKLRGNGYGTFNDIDVKGVVEFTNTAQFAIFTRVAKSGVKQYEYFNRLWPLSPDSYEIEIIGNIHEDKNLLK